MLMDLLSAEYCGDYKIKLVFEDNASGIVDFSSYARRSGVFEKFKDVNYFKDFRIDPEIKTLVWGKDIDIAPETLYSYVSQSKAA